MSPEVAHYVVGAPGGILHLYAENFQDPAAFAL